MELSRKEDGFVYDIGVQHVDLLLIAPRVVFLQRLGRIRTVICGSKACTDMKGNSIHETVYLQRTSEVSCFSVCPIPS